MKAHERLVEGRPTEALEHSWTKNIPRLARADSTDAAALQMCRCTCANAAAGFTDMGAHRADL